MQTIDNRKLVLGVVVLLLAGAGKVYAAETPVNTQNVDMTLAAEPARYSFIKGDSSKFRALNWMDDGFAFGVNDFTAKTKFKDNVTLETEGHLIPEDGNYSGLMHLTKEDIGYLNFDYSGFRKYYSNAGGFYRPFALLNQNYTDKELALNIGKFGFETGLTLKNMPELILNYQREFKEGTKSRLSWASVVDTVEGVSKTRKIAPSWQQIDQISDSFGTKVNATTAGFNWKAEQKWEYIRSRNMREEQQLATVVSGSPNSNLKIRDESQEPRQSILTTLLGVNRWFMKDNLYASSDYRFSQNESRELATIVEMDGNRIPHNFSNSKTWLPSSSDNHYTSQTWVSSIMSTLWNPFSVITRVKAETIHRQSESTTRWDKTTVPDGAPDSIDVSENQQKLMRYGESVSVRYSGIPRVALYNDYELEQTRNNIYENANLNSPTTPNEFHYQDLNHQFRGSGTLGAQYVPWSQLTMTLQGRHRRDELNYDRPPFTGDPLILVASQDILTNEAMARTTWKPCKWFQPSFRYQLMDRRFQTVQEGFNADPVETAQEMNVYTWDVVSQPLNDLLLMASFSFTDGKIITPVRYNGTVNEAAATVAIPTYNFDSYTTLVSAEYVITKDLSLTGTMNYTRAANFNDFSSTGLPYGTDFHQTDLIFGCRWQAKKDLAIEPKYAWYQYTADGNDVGSFNAHVLWLEAKANW